MVKHQIMNTFTFKTEQESRKKLLKGVAGTNSFPTEEVKARRDLETCINSLISTTLNLHKKKKKVQDLDNTSGS